jgi:hypothetical protein
MSEKPWRGRSPREMGSLPAARRSGSSFIQRKMRKNLAISSIQRLRSRLYYYMKKILLLSAVLLGAVTASQAGGVHFSIGIPFPAPPVVVAPAPPVVVAAPAPAYIAPPSVYVAPAPMYAPAPPVVVAPPVIQFGFSTPYYHSYGYHPYYGHDHYYHGYHGHDGGHYRH